MEHPSLHVQWMRPRLRSLSFILAAPPVARNLIFGVQAIDRLTTSPPTYRIPVDAQIENRILFRTHRISFSLLFHHTPNDAIVAHGWGWVPPDAFVGSYLLSDAASLKSLIRNIQALKKKKQWVSPHATATWPFFPDDTGCVRLFGTFARSPIGRSTTPLVDCPRPTNAPIPTAYVRVGGFVPGGGVFPYPVVIVR